MIQDYDVYKPRVDTRSAFDYDQTERGLLDYIDLGYDANIAARNVSVYGLDALINKIILYFASSKGDYLRSTKGGEFDFLKGARSSAAVEFRIVSTAMAIMRKRFSKVQVDDIKAEPFTSDAGSLGWRISLTLTYGTRSSEDLSNTYQVQIPLGINRDELLKRASVSTI